MDARTAQKTDPWCLVHGKTDQQALMVDMLETCSAQSGSSRPTCTRPVPAVLVSDHTWQQLSHTPLLPPEPETCCTAPCTLGTG
jgi:hypothetical protein